MLITSATVRVCICQLGEEVGTRLRRIWCTVGATKLPSPGLAQNGPVRVGQQAVSAAIPMRLTQRALDPSKHGAVPRREVVEIFLGSGILYPSRPIALSQSSDLPCPPPPRSKIPASAYPQHDTAIAKPFLIPLHLAFNSCTESGRESVAQPYMIIVLRSSQKPGPSGIT